MWNYWIWEGTWRVLASYTSKREALDAASQAADQKGTWAVCPADGLVDRKLRENVHQRYSVKFLHSMR